MNAMCFFKRVYTVYDAILDLSYKAENEWNWFIKDQLIIKDVFN